MQRLRVIADNLQAAALGWPLWAEGTNNHNTAGPHCAADLADVCESVTRRGEEMKDSTVVPHIVSRRLQTRLGIQFGSAHM